MILGKIVIYQPCHHTGICAKQYRLLQDVKYEITTGRNLMSGPLYSIENEIFAMFPGYYRGVVLAFDIKTVILLLN
jgi:hypothetical protein